MWNAGNLGFKVVTINVGDPVVLNEQSCLLGMSQWNDDVGNVDMRITVDAANSKGNGDGWSVMIPGMTDEPIVKENLQFGMLVYRLVLGGFDVEMQWLPPGFKLEMSGGFNKSDKRSFVVAYAKNGRKQ